MKKLPLYRQIQEDIRQQIIFGSLKPGDRLPSEMDFSRKYFVSQITSKNALNGLVDEGYLVRIQGKGTFVANNPPVGEITYHFEPTLESAPKGIIGLLLPAMVTKVSQKLLNYIEKFISQENYLLLIHNTRESLTDEAMSIGAMRISGVKGLLIFPAVDEMYNEAILRLTLDKFPLVLVDRALKSIPICSVTSDNITGMYEATEHLLAKNHKQISIISPKITNSVVEERVSGYENCLSDHHIPIDRSLWCILDYDINDTAYAYNAIKTFYQAHPEITAAICVNSEMAQIAYYALQELGQKIPEDFELTSFDQPYTPNTSYIMQNEEEIARKAVNLLMLQVEGGATVQSVKVQTQFVDYTRLSKQEQPYHLLYVLNSGSFST